MSMPLKITAIVLLSGLLAGCGHFDSGLVWRGGPYALIWIDIPDDVKLSYDAGKGSWLGRVDARVFAVGWDGRYVVAKQHPKGDKNITNYFVIDSQKDSLNADAEKVVIGPLGEEEFQKRSAELKLPPFTKVLESLK
jgi:hypothetical protein